MFRCLAPILTAVWLALPGPVAAQDQAEAFRELASYVTDNFLGTDERVIPAHLPDPACDNTRPARSHAILMGAADAGTVQPRMLGGSENSVALIKATLVRIGVPEQRIHALTRNDATRRGLYEALDKVRFDLNCTDKVFLYFTTVMTDTQRLSQQIYGDKDSRDWIAEGADRNPTLRALSEASPFLMFNVSDERPNDLLSAESLTDMLVDLRNRSAHVTLVLDTAFSGRFDLQGRQLRRNRDALWSARPIEQEDATVLAPRAGDLTVMYSSDPYSYAAQIALPEQAADAQVYGIFAYKLAAALYADKAMTPSSLARNIDGLRLSDTYAQYENHRVDATDPGQSVLAEGIDAAQPVVPQAAPQATPNPVAPRDGTQVIRITSPAATRSAAALQTPTLTVEGQVDWPEQTMIVLVNRSQALSRADGSFSHQVTLEPGLNQIEVVAMTRDNLQHSRVLEVTYEGDVEALMGQGQRYAVLIANQTYSDASGMPSLTTPEADIDAIAAELTGRYGFVTEATLPGGGTLPLILRNASRAEIETLLFQVSRIVGVKDTVLLYYGGHGIYEGMTDTAFWVPSDAVAGVPPTYLSASAISEALLRLQADNVLVISDSCYSGALMRGAPGSSELSDEDRARALQRLASRRSRILITSGANEPVADQGGDGHSVFARALLNGLRQSEPKAFSSRELFDDFILPFVVGRSGQEPQYRPIARSGHEGGDVVFVRLRD